jgi:putative salt-induced outer membrane protein YdiY
MKGKGIAALFTALLVFLAGAQAAADEVWLKNGDHLTGKVKSLDGGTLLFNTAYAGDLSIKWEEVVNLRTDDPVKVVLGDETSAQGPVTPGDSGKVKVKPEQVAEPVTVDLANIKTINPKPPVTKRFRANVGYSLSDGNTNTEDIYADAEFVARTIDNRYTIGARYKRSENENVKTEDNAFGYMKYDHFFTKKWYGYANATGEQDEFKDLDLRTTLGAGAGYQFIESERTHLSLEGGLSYVDENYIVNEDNSFAAGRWGLRFDHFILPKSLQYFLSHEGLQSVEDSDDLLLFTQTGFRVPFYKNLNITAQFNWDYDKSPSPGKKESDYTYLLTLGYNWSK